MTRTTGTAHDQIRYSVQVLIEFCKSFLLAHSGCMFVAVAMHDVSAISSEDQDESPVESLAGSLPSSSTESDEPNEQAVVDNTEIEVIARRGADVSLNIHDQLDLAKLRRVSRTDELVQ